MSLNKIINYLLLLLLFLLPWQTRWIYKPGVLNGGFWEYGTRSLYATEILLWLVIILFAVGRFRHKEYCPDLEGLRIPTRRREQRVLNYEYFFTALWLGGVVQGALAVWQFFTQAVIANKWLGIAGQSPGELGSFVIELASGRWLRAYGAFGSPNILGGYLAVVFIVGLLLYFESSPRQKVLMTLGQIFILLGLILSFSRGAWLAAAVGALALCVIARSEGTTWLRRSVATPRRAKQSPDRSAYPANNSSSEIKGIATSVVPPRRDSLLAMTIKQIIFSLLIVATLAVILKPLFLIRLEGTGRLEEKSITERVSQYQEFSRIFSTHPFFGVGPGAYTLALYEQNSHLPVWRYQPVHNVYLLMLAELGIIGCFLVFLFFYFFVKLVWKNNRIFLPILIPLSILGLFDHWLWSMYFGLLFSFAVLGCLLSSVFKPKN